MGRLRVVLEDVRITSPCSVSWEDMTGDARVRHCAKCNLDVFNLSSMSRDEAEALLTEKLGSGTRVCGGGIRRADGSFISGECPSGDLAHHARFLGATSIACSVILAVFVIAISAFSQLRRISSAESAGAVFTADQMIERSPTLSGISRVARGQSFKPPPKPAYGYISEF